MRCAADAKKIADTLRRVASQGANDECVPIYSPPVGHSLHHPEELRRKFPRTGDDVESRRQDSDSAVLLYSPKMAPALRCGCCSGKGLHLKPNHSASSVPCVPCGGIGWFGINPHVSTPASPGTIVKAAVLAARFRRLDMLLLTAGTRQERNVPDFFMECLTTEQVLRQHVAYELAKESPDFGAVRRLISRPPIPDGILMTPARAAIELEVFSAWRVGDGTDPEHE